MNTIVTHYTLRLHRNDAIDIIHDLVYLHHQHIKQQQQIHLSHTTHLHHSVADELPLNPHTLPTPLHQLHNNHHKHPRPCLRIRIPTRTRTQT